MFLELQRMRLFHYGSTRFQTHFCDIRHFSPKELFLVTALCLLTHPTLGRPTPFSPRRRVSLPPCRTPVLSARRLVKVHPTGNRCWDRRLSPLLATRRRENRRFDPLRLEALSFPDPSPIARLLFFFFFSFCFYPPRRIP